MQLVWMMATIACLWREVAGQGAEPLILLNQSIVENYTRAGSSDAVENCKKVPGIASKCKLAKGDNLACKIDTTFKISATWETDELCMLPSHYEKIGRDYLKLSSMVFNITSNWTKFYDNKINGILNSNKKSFICDFVARKYKQDFDQNFFFNSWLPSAKKCMSFLTNARRSVMCAVCTKSALDAFKPNNELEVNHQSCLQFNDACLDYFDAKLVFIDFLNIIFTLELCDYNGQYTSQDDNKKVLPSNLIFESENLMNCRALVFKKERNLKPEVKLKYEESCIRLCRDYFSLTGMIEDDFKNFDSLFNIHEVLKDLVLESVSKNTFNTKINDLEPIPLDLYFIKFNFTSSLDPKGLDIAMHLKDNNYRIFEIDKFLKSASLHPLLILFSCVIWAISL